MPPAAELPRRREDVESEAAALDVRDRLLEVVEAKEVTELPVSEDEEAPLI